MCQSVNQQVANKCFTIRRSEVDEFTYLILEVRNIKHLKIIKTLIPETIITLL